MSTHKPARITAETLAATLAPAPAPTGVLDVQKAFDWLADIAATDVVLGRLAEGHVDALRILHEAGRRPYDGSYGVWASASGGTGLAATPADGGFLISGTMRFCSGAGILDRALVVAAAGEDKLLLDVDAHRPELVIDRDSWPAVGMARSESFTIEVTDLFVATADVVGEPGFYLGRTGFAVGGIGVAATWLGAVRGLRELIVRYLAAKEPTPFQLAYLGGIAVAVAAADSVVQDAIGRVQAGTGSSMDTSALLVRSVVERSVTESLELATRAVGPAGLCLDGRLAAHIADLGVYIRQHHGDVDLARLGSALREEHRVS